jgi:uncharacterized protein affecting Mg2+/Co2+ transport
MDSSAKYAAKAWLASSRTCCRDRGFETPVGAMHGTYQMVSDDGQCFEAPIPVFRLAIPGLLH